MFSYLLFQIVNSCASYYPSSCDYSPRSTTTGDAAVAGAWSLFIDSANLLPICGGGNLNYSRNEAMASTVELEPLRMRSSFPLFQLGHAKKEKKDLKDRDQFMFPK